MELKPVDGKGRRGVTSADFEKLVRSLTALPGECEWVEFKHNNEDPQELGEYLSALANSAALHGKHAGYILWGVQDVTQALIGTAFKPRQKKIGNAELENWLAVHLEPRIDFTIHEGAIGGISCVVFEVQPATHRPVAFKDVEYVRVGSYKKKLKEHPEKERLLWKLFNEVQFEKGIASAGVSGEEVLSTLDYAEYFRMMDMPLPEKRAGILKRLEAENLVHASRAENITTSRTSARFCSRGNSPISDASDARRCG